MAGYALKRLKGHKGVPRTGAFANVLLLGASTLVLSSCASVLNGTTQKVRFITPLADGAKCVITDVHDNEYIIMSTPDTLEIDKSGGSLTVECSKDWYETKTIKVYKYFDPFTLGNLVQPVFQGGVPLAVDVANGSFRGYPAEVAVWMEPYFWDSEAQRQNWLDTKKAYEKSVIYEHFDQLQGNRPPTKTKPALKDYELCYGGVARKGNNYNRKACKDAKPEPEVIEPVTPPPAPPKPMVSPEANTQATRRAPAEQVPNPAIDLESKMGPTLTPEQLERLNKPPVVEPLPAAPEPIDPKNPPVPKVLREMPIEEEHIDPVLAPQPIDPKNPPIPKVLVDDPSLDRAHMGDEPAWKKRSK